MRILATNDDGIDAEGIDVLCKIMQDFGEVYLIAPDNEQSAVGHSITLAHPLRVREVHRNGSIFGYAVNGTPADCIKLALYELPQKLFGEGAGPESFDLLVSGINRGANLGINLFYSGTVAAAHEGVIAGVPSIAISVEGYAKVDFQQAAPVARRVIGKLIECRAKTRWTFLNINIPSAPESEIRGVKISRQNPRGFEERFEERRTPRDEIIFWMTGGIIPLAETDEDDTRHIAEKYVSVTPLCYDMTNYRLKEILEKTDLAQALEKKEDKKQ